MPTCSSCHHESSADARFCAFCGQPLAEPASLDTGEPLSDVAIAIQSLTNFSDTSEDPRLLTALRPYDEGHFELAATTLEPLAREGNLVAIFKLGTTFDRLGRTADAIALWEVAAQQGEPGSQNNLGRVLKERGQMAEAEELFRQSAAQGNPQATYNLSGLLLNRGDKQGYERLLRDLGRTGYTIAFGRLGLLALESPPGLTDRDALRAIHHLSLGARQGDATCFSGMAVAALRFGQWHLIEPWLDEAVANVPADGSADWIPPASQSVRLAGLVAERRWDDVLDWLANPANSTDEVSPGARQAFATAITERAQNPSLLEEVRSAYLEGAATGLGRFGNEPFENHRPMQRPVLNTFPPAAKKISSDPSIALVSDADRESIIARVDTKAMAQLARAALNADLLDEADFWFLEWITANCPFKDQLEGLVAYCESVLFPQDRHEEAGLYFSVIDWLPDVSTPPGFLACLLVTETARHFSPLGAVRYSQAWKTVDRSVPLSSELPLNLQYSLILAGLMSGDEREGGEKARAVNAGLREHYLSHVAGLFIGLCKGLQQSKVSHEIIARAANDWLAFRLAREEAPSPFPK